jgi:hypothetical protein
MNEFIITMIESTEYILSNDICGITSITSVFVSQLFPTFLTQTSSSETAICILNTYIQFYIQIYENMRTSFIYLELMYVYT